MIALDDALVQLLEAAPAIQETEIVPLLDADGRVLAQDCIAPLAVPGHDNSAMDGYALRCTDVPVAGTILPVSQRIPAGSMPFELEPGTMARIFTGAPIPAGADAVVMQELCASAGTDALQRPLVRCESMLTPGQCIRRTGEDIQQGSVLLNQGARLNPVTLGLAASVGLAQLSVVRRPRVALFATGNELVMPGTVAPQDLPAGHIFNSNRFFLHRLLERLGCDVTDCGHVDDTFDATVQALANAAQEHDVILTTGGVSVGEEDYVRTAVQSLGQLDLWQIAIKPGKPFAHGQIGNAHVIGLPGNPVSSFVTFLLLVRPFILRIQGVQDVDLPRLALRAEFARTKPDRRREFLRGRRNRQGGVELFPNQGSGVLTSIAWADGLVDVASGQTIEQGDMVSFISFSDAWA